MKRPLSSKSPPGAPMRHFPLRPHHLVERITPVKDLFVLSPLGAPEVDLDTWRLTIDGMVERPLTLTFDDILQMPKRVVEAFHQCAGNPRQWNHPTRRITNLVWGGVDLAEVLSRVNIDPKARFLWSYGMDHGLYQDTAIDNYIKDLPVHEIAACGALLVYEVNGEFLPPENGFPLRLVVPGYYATNSVKWLCRLHFAEERSKGYFTTVLYNDPTPPTEAEPNGGTKPVWEIAVESVIVSPAPRTRVTAGIVDVWGWAWARDGVASVKVSADGGGTWQAADLEPQQGQSWQKFHLAWRCAREEGQAVLMSCATDRYGNCQPATGARNAIYSVPVFFGDSAPGSFPQAEYEI